MTRVKRSGFRRFISAFMLVVAVALSLAPPILAQAANEGGAEPGAGIIFLWIVIILLAAKLSLLVERIGQPPVFGELLIGVILGNVVLLGLDFFEPLKSDAIINFLAQL